MIIASGRKNGRSLTHHGWRQPFGTLFVGQAKGISPIQNAGSASRPRSKAASSSTTAPVGPFSKKGKSLPRRRNHRHARRISEGGTSSLSATPKATSSARRLNQLLFPPTSNASKASSPKKISQVLGRRPYERSHSPATIWRSSKNSN